MNGDYTTATSITPQESIIQSLFQRTNGENWDIITFPTQFNFTEEELNVRWTNFTSTSNVTRSMAVHPHPDIVSDNIYKHQRYRDCDILPQRWRNKDHLGFSIEGVPSEVDQQDPSKSAAEKRKQKVYVDIGANIGSCVMEMLLSTSDSFIVAFEPHPKNRLCLIQTISKLEPHYQERIVIVPVGLGDKQGSSTIYSARNNMGNSVVGQIIKDNDGQAFDKKSQTTIQIERLDSIFNPYINETNVEIPLLKLDAQGYECRILEGMGKKPSVADTIHQIKLEYAQKWLHGQNCTDLIHRLHDLGFDLYDDATNAHIGIDMDSTKRTSFVEIIAKQHQKDKA